jgi:hypothetical protein
MQVTVVNPMVKFCVSFHFLALFLNNDHFTMELFHSRSKDFPLQYVFINNICILIIIIKFFEWQIHKKHANDH